MLKSLLCLLGLCWISLPRATAAETAPSTPPPTGEVFVKHTDGFETPAEQTLHGGHYQGAVSFDTTEAHSGKASLKIERDNQTQEVYWRSLGVGVSAGGTYRFSCWMKFAHVVMPDPSYSPEVHVLFVNALNAGLSDVVIADSWKFTRDDNAAEQSCDWTYHEKLITAPAGAIGAFIKFTFNKTTGTAWLDDLRVTYEPDAAIPGQAPPNGFLMLWPARAGEKGSIRKADGTFFNPGEPLDWFVKAPASADPAKPSVVQWKIHDSLDRPLLSGSSDVPAGTALPKITLPSLDAQQARWLRCDWTWEQDGKAKASRLTSILVLPPVNPYPADRLGIGFAPGDTTAVRRLGGATARCNIFWQDKDEPTPDEPVHWTMPWSGAQQQVEDSAKAGQQVLAELSWTGPKWAYLHPDGPHISSEGWASQPDILKKVVLQTVTDFKDYVKFWQLGNEVVGNANAQLRHDYMVDATAFYEAVKTVDPKAQVLLGSQGGALSNVRLAVQEGLLNDFDIYDCHYQSVNALREVRSFLDQAAPGRHIPIWETECGMFYLVPDDVYASEFIRIMATNVGEGVDRSFWCGLGGSSFFGEREGLPPDQNQSGYLADPTRMPGQLCASHVLCTEFFGNSVPVKPLDSGRAHGYLLRHDNTWTAVVWAEGLEPLPVVLRGVGSHVKIADWTARHAELDTQAGALPLVLSNRPWLVQWTTDQAPDVAFDLNPPLTVQSEHSRLLYKGTQNQVTVTLPANAAAQDVDFDAGLGVTITPSKLHLKPGDSQSITVAIPADDDSDRLTLDARSPGAWLAWEYSLKPALSGADQTAAAATTGASASQETVDLSDASAVSWETPSKQPSDLVPDPLGTMSTNVYCLARGGANGKLASPIEDAKSISLECDAYTESSGFSLGMSPPSADPDHGKAYFLSIGTEKVGIALRDGPSGPWLGLAHALATRPPGWAKMKLVWSRDGMLQIYLNGDLYAETEDTHIPLSIGYVEIMANGQGKRYFANPKIIITR
ncbi:MAG TPA: hypothetical protein VHY09_02925 [Candidatus Methylacidiphilales bacterium]|jgi:hypothetical protein|nr:hypothetical protein [Candidatus Methylacidiphilales bacterium]